MLEVGRPVLIRGSPNRDEDDIRGAYRRGNIGCEREPPVGEVALDERLEARLKDGNLTCIQPGDFVLEKEMAEAAEELDFERAALLRDQLFELRAAGTN